MLKPLTRLLVCLILCAAYGTAQEYDRVELYGGYSYLNIDTNGLTSRQGLNGWETSFSYNINGWLAAEGDISGYYKGYSYRDGDNSANAHVSNYGYVFGPRFNFRANDSVTVFAHTLFGGDHLGAGASGNLFGSSVSGSGSADAFAMAIGGGIQFNVARHLAVRTSADYVLTRFNIFNPDNPYNQNNYRIGVGIVYTFGRSTQVASTQAHQPNASHHQPAATQSGQSGNEQLGQFRLENLGISGKATGGDGFAVTSVLANSKAASAGIVVGDHIVAVDGKPINTNGDLFNALSLSNGTLVITTSKPGSNQTEQHQVTMWMPSK